MHMLPVPVDDRSWIDRVNALPVITTPRTMCCASIIYRETVERCCRTCTAEICDQCAGEVDSDYDGVTLWCKTCADFMGADDAA